VTFKGVEGDDLFVSILKSLKRSDTTSSAENVTLCCKKRRFPNAVTELETEL